jgi:biopolymer transport protein ExbD
MPSVKMPRKSTDTDMTPFVDVAFLILSFFMLATKFKPPEPVEIATPNSVSMKEVELTDGVQVWIDKEDKVYFSMMSESDEEPMRKVITNLNTTRGLNLSEKEISAFVKNPMVGVPFNQLKSYLSLPQEQMSKFKSPGIPVDTADNQLYYWIRDSRSAFAGKNASVMIKGDNKSKYPVFKKVMDAFQKNDINSFKLVTGPEEAPVGSELWVERQNKGSKKK